MSILGRVHPCAVPSTNTSTPNTPNTSNTNTSTSKSTDAHEQTSEQGRKRGRPLSRKEEELEQDAGHAHERRVSEGEEGDLKKLCSRINDDAGDESQMIGTPPDAYHSDADPDYYRLYRVAQLKNSILQLQLAYVQAQCQRLLTEQNNVQDRVDELVTCFKVWAQEIEDDSSNSYNSDSSELELPCEYQSSNCTAESP